MKIWTQACIHAKKKKAKKNKQNQGDVFTSQGSKVLGVRREPCYRFVPTALRGTNPADILILYF